MSNGSCGFLETAASELVRALLLINGGGAAALLAFLQSIFN